MPGRKSKNMTQQVLADASGIHVTQIRRYEGGKSQQTADIVRRLALGLSVSADVLLFDPEERGPSGCSRPPPASTTMSATRFVR